MAKTAAKAKARTSWKVPRELYTFAKDLGLLVGYHLAEHVKRRDDIKAVLQDTVDNLDGLAEKSERITKMLRKELGLPCKGGGR